MKFYSMRDLRAESKQMWETLSANQEVVITNNGKPAALMIDVNEDNFEEMLRAIRQAKAMLAINSMRATAHSYGYLSEDEINAEILSARTENSTQCSRVAEGIAYECRP